MTKKILMVMAFLTMATTIYAQRRVNREKLKSLKVAFLTDRLDLSSSEAEAFWPIYNDHEDKMSSFRKTERTEIRSKIRNLESLSEKDAEQLIRRQLELQVEKQEEQQKFIKNIQGILSAKKTILLLKSEEDFKRKLIQQYRQRRGAEGGLR